MNDIFVFTEIINCGKIGRIALQSYHRHHNYPVHIFGTVNDFMDLGDEVFHNDNTIPVVVSDNDRLLDKFKKGHEGTAALMAQVCKNKFGEYARFIRFDSDIYFKQECLSIVEQAFDEGYDIVGTRRCYGNNPGGVPNLHGYPDTVSTYFMGLNLEKLPDYSIETLSKMCQGAWHPLGYPTLDFFDPVTHVMLETGAKMKFLDRNEFGSQDENGKKVNDYELNLHMDCGSKLIHLGGIASGYSYFNKQSNPEKSYGEWALGRYSLFAKVFYNEDIGYNAPTVYGSDSRWVNGSYDDHILELVKKEIG